MAPPGKAFLISDLNGDRLLQRDEFDALATALAVSSSNAVPWLFQLQSRLLARAGFEGALENWEKR